MVQLSIGVRLTFQGVSDAKSTLRRVCSIQLRVDPHVYHDDGAQGSSIVPPYASVSLLNDRYLNAPLTGLIESRPVSIDCARPGFTKRLGAAVPGVMRYTPVLAHVDWQ